MLLLLLSLPLLVTFKQCFVTFKQCAMNQPVPGPCPCLFPIPPAQAFGYVCAPNTYISRKDEGDKMIVFERGDLVFVFNFHPTMSYRDYRVGCREPGQYKVGPWQYKAAVHVGVWGGLIAPH